MKTLYITLLVAITLTSCAQDVNSCEVQCPDYGSLPMSISSPDGSKFVPVKMVAEWDDNVSSYVFEIRVNDSITKYELYDEYSSWFCTVLVIGPTHDQCRCYLYDYLSKSYNTQRTYRYFDRKANVITKRHKVIDRDDLRFEISIKYGYKFTRYY